MTLKEYLKANKISVSKFAKLIPCSQSYISKVKDDVKQPGWKMACRIEQVSNNKVSKAQWYPNE